MSEDTPPQEPKSNVVSLVSVRNDREEVINSTEETQFIDSLEWVNTFLEEVIEKIVKDSTSPMTGISVVITHGDGGVSHAHKCERDSLIHLLGAMEIKKLRMVTAFDLEKK